jgi:hypothetical protein
MNAELQLDINWAKKAQLKQGYKISLSLHRPFFKGMYILTRAFWSFFCHITVCVSQTTAKKGAMWINSIQSSEIYLESWMRLSRRGGEPEVYLSFSNLRLFRRTFVDKRIRHDSIDPPLHPFPVKKQKNQRRLSSLLIFKRMD